MSDESELRRLIHGGRVAQAVHVAATLGIADLLAEGPRTSDELARATETHEDSLYRLLRALAREGVLSEGPGRTFSLTELGEGLRSDVPGSMRSMAEFFGRPYHWNAWSQLLHSVRTGENAFAALNGRSVWKYRAEHPEESEIFNRYMATLTREVDSAIVAGYDFGRFAHIVDVGGNRGGFLEAILEANPGVAGTLFDQEHVVADVPSHDRRSVVVGSFFEEVPRGGDAYLLKSVIHDWGDEEAAAILRTVAGALGADGRVLVVEHDLSRSEAAWLDLQMLVMLGGRERTEDEYADLFRAAGLEYLEMQPAGAGFAVFEAGP